MMIMNWEDHEKNDIYLFETKLKWKKKKGSKEYYGLLDY